MYLTWHLVLVLLLQHAPMVREEELKQQSAAALIALILGSEVRAHLTKMSLQRYHAAANASREGYAVCSQRVLREVDRFKREKAEEMKCVVLDVILLEIDVNRAMERARGALVPRLATSPIRLDCLHLI